jgi:beta-galactosidase
VTGGWRFRFEDESDWQPVDLPHSWNALDTMDTDPACHYRRGVGIYERDFPALGMHPEQSRQRWLEFGAVAQRARVYFDGALIAEHHGGYTAFTVDLPPEAGRLRVEADNRPDPDLIPSDRSDFFLYGGITRPVILCECGSLRIERLWCDVDTSPERARLRLRGQIRGDIQPGDALVINLKPRQKRGLLSTVSHRLTSPEFSIDLPEVISPRLWSPDDPYLHRLWVSALRAGQRQDDDLLPVGFRHCDFPAGGPFYLNGERLLLRGTHRHDDWAGGGPCADAATIERELRAIRDAGFNFIRLGHYPQDATVLTLCDQLGLIVWEELPWCRGGVGGDTFRQHARAMLTEMIDQHYHHPSILFWGLGNELDWESDHPASTEEHVTAFLSELNDLAHRLDPRRLTALRRFEPGASIVDVYSPSIWSGWYRGRYEDYPAALGDALAKYPRLLHIEWGGDSHAGRHNDGPHIISVVDRAIDHAETPGLATSEAGDARYSRDGDWSESYILDLMCWHLRAQAALPNLGGSAQWVYKDFGTPLRPENPIPYVNQKGLVTRDGQPKDAYFLFKAFQNPRPLVRIEASAWPVRVGQPGAPQTVRVITNCEQVRLVVDGRSAGVKTRDPGSGAADILTWEILLAEGQHMLKAIGYVGGNNRARHEIAQPFVAGNLGPVAQITAAIQPAPGDCGFIVVVQLADSEGRPVTTDEREVRFELTGAGRLDDRHGVMGGSQVIETANGRAWCRLYADGPLRVMIQADGLFPLDVPLD